MKEATPEVSQKWGFGMAPPKDKTQALRVAACRDIVRLLISGEFPRADTSLLEAISEVKGLFNRIVRQDQWDWFTVHSQLGFPQSHISKLIARELTNLRTAVKQSDKGAFSDAHFNLRRLPARTCLAIFLGQAKLVDNPNHGWVYVLSTRETSKLLKIGMTTRTVQERVHEINSATGVAIPFGVRRCWRVSDPAYAEKKVHQALNHVRVRDDREFFRISYRDATSLIQQTISERKLGVLTLDAVELVKNSTHAGR